MTTVRESSTGKLRKSETLPQGLDRRLLFYAVAAGAVLTAVPGSQAEVVFTPSNAVFQGLGKFDIDLDNDGSADFSIVARWTQYDTSNMIQALFAQGNGPSHQIAATKFGDAAKLKKGTQIGPGQTFRAFALMETPFYRGYWQYATKSRCLGVRFLINGEVHYGWIGFREVRAYPAVAGRLFGWAYETVPDTAILAGDTGTAAPLDSSISPTSLEILAAGHTAIGERRKRNPSHRN